MVYGAVWFLQGSVHKKVCKLNTAVFNFWTGKSFWKFKWRFGFQTFTLLIKYLLFLNHSTLHCTLEHMGWSKQVKNTLKYWQEKDMKCKIERRKHNIEPCSSSQGLKNRISHTHTHIYKTQQFIIFTFLCSML